MKDSATYKSKLKIPKFATEADEAEWWYDNRGLVSAEFQKAAKDGRLGRGGARRLFVEKGIPFPEPQKVTSSTPPESE